MKWALVVLALAGCGDGVAFEPEVTATSGTRLVTTWLGYADGARQLRRDRVFDLVEGTDCRPMRWADGVVRCVPVADEAVFADAACSRAVGRVHTNTHPTHFIGFDRNGGTAVPTRLYRAGDVVDPLTVIYERRDGACVGPFSATPGLVHHAVLGEIDATTLATVDEVDGGGDGGRMALHVWRSPDGLWLPTGLFDRDLGFACNPAVDGDERTRCRPRQPIATHRFADSACSEPVVVAGSPPGDGIAEVTDEAGCARDYRLVGERSEQTAYVRTASGCFADPVGFGQRVYGTTGPLALAELERTVEDERWRRLQRIVVTGGGVRIADDRMYDTGMRGDCRPLDVDGVTRCVPETVAAVTTTLFTSGSCQVSAAVALMPQPTCRQARFARVAGASFRDLRLIGDPRTDETWLLFGRCQPYMPSTGQVAHDVGPPIDPALFVGAFQFGDR